MRINSAWTTRGTMLVGMTLVSLFAFQGCERQSLWEGKTFTVEYRWESGIRSLRVKESDSGKQITDRALRKRITEETSAELAHWIALSKLRRAEGTFHIEFRASGLTPSIVEIRRGVEGITPEFIKDPDITPLMMIAPDGQLDRVRELVIKGENVNARDQHGNAAVMFAGSAEVLAFLLDHGADINAHNMDGETPLTYALASQRSAIVKELIRRGAILNCSNPTEQAAWMASKKRSKNLLPLLKTSAVNCKD